MQARPSRENEVVSCPYLCDSLLVSGMPGGVLLIKIWVGVSDALLETFTPYQTKIKEFLYTISDQTLPRDCFGFRNLL